MITYWAYIEQIAIYSNDVESDVFQFVEKKHTFELFSVSYKWTLYII